MHDERTNAGWAALRLVGEAAGLAVMPDRASRAPLWHSSIVPSQGQPV